MDLPTDLFLTLSAISTKNSAARTQRHARRCSLQLPQSRGRVANVARFGSAAPTRGKSSQSEQRDCARRWNQIAANDDVVDAV